MMNETALLQHSLAELSIQDAARKSERLHLPPESLMVQFNGIANNVMTKMSDVCTCHRRDMAEFFGAPTIVISKLWELIVKNRGGDDTQMSKEHLSILCEVLSPSRDLIQSYEGVLFTLKVHHACSSVQ